MYAIKWSAALTVALLCFGCGSDDGNGGGGEGQDTSTVDAKAGADVTGADGGAATGTDGGANTGADVGSSDAGAGPTDAAGPTADSGGGGGGGVSPVPTGAFAVSKVADGQFNRVYGVHGTAADNIFIIGDSGLFRWDGAAWTKSNGQGGKGLYVVDAKTVWSVAGQAAPVQLWADGENISCAVEGKCTTDGLANQPLYDIHGVGADKIWAVGKSGMLLSLVDAAGRKWKKLASGSKGNLNAVWATSATDVWIAGETGHIVHGDGTTFAEVDTGIKDFVGDLHDIWASGPKDVWAVGKFDAIHFDGVKWARVPGVKSAWRVFGFGPNDIWLVAKTAKPSHWNGEKLTEFEPPHSSEQIWGLSRDDFWVVGANGKVAFNGEVLRYQK